ncbi:RhuM family protein [Bacteroides sp. 224]|uniref:RhuM family protein n=1 Tax=Bacteroides sp. 224 TaxID=2302936 RepID=UPI0013D00D24|nr:RhuM family protein [Bacteroides sp. 224]NDV65496.1 cytochrome C biogenesis protein CycH [Bacteroides sp. 224]
MNTGEIVIYQTQDGKTNLDVKLENETVWLTQAQMVKLFNRERSVITKHINNVFSEGELDEKSNVQNLHIAFSDKPVKSYSLDVIISVGYRVKSAQGTQFRIWANQILKDYLIKGYAINQNIKVQQYDDLKSTVKLLSNVLQLRELSLDEATGLLKVITDFTYALDTLDKYDYQQLSVEQTTNKEVFRADYDNAMEAILYLKEKFNSGNLFGNEKDESFKSSINVIYQTFGGEELYPSIEEKAAMLLYLVTKNHSFSDGNKRIAAFLFLWFLEKNEILYKPDGSKLIENNTLVAITLMIAESRTEEKDMIVKVIVNLINRNN